MEQVGMLLLAQMLLVGVLLALLLSQLKLLWLDQVMVVPVDKLDKNPNLDLDNEGLDQGLAIEGKNIYIENLTLYHEHKNLDLDLPLSPPGKKKKAYLVEDIPHIQQ